MKSRIHSPARPLLAPLFAFAAFGLNLPAGFAAPAAVSPVADINHAGNSGMSGRSGNSAAHHTGAPLKASDLIGQNLENNEGQNVGSVEDLAIDLQAGRVVQLIVSTGGFLSMGERHTAVPPGQVQFRAAGKALRFETTREKLKAAPAFEMSGWQDFFQSERVRESNRYYGEERTFDAVVAQDNLPAIVTSKNGLGHVERASKLMGLTVQNLREETIGTVDNLIVDLSAGRVVAVIVSSGGFLGLGDTLSVVPPTALRFNADHDRLRLDTTKETLAAAPRFKTGEWPDFAQRDYTAGVYRAYQQDAYLERQPDNSGRNTRDRDGRTLTPADQGGHAIDIKTTQEIRRAVVAADGLSVNAKNVKIITVEGRVTLRGPVGSGEEKALIAAIATRVAGAAYVDNQLEVSPR